MWNFCVRPNLKNWYSLLKIYTIPNLLKCMKMFITVKVLDKACNVFKDKYNNNKKPNIIPQVGSGDWRG